MNSVIYKCICPFMFYKHFLQITIMSWIGTLYIYVYKFEEKNAWSSAIEDSNVPEFLA